MIHELPNLVGRIEAVLFVAEAPVSLPLLAQLLAVPEGVVEEGVALLNARLADQSAVMVLRIAGGYQLSTRPEYAELVERFLKPQHQRLSRSLLEVLAIVAYRQPVTQSEVETVRAVQSDYGIRVLVERGLIKEVGRKESPGRPILYGTTQQFLHQLNLDNLAELPDVEGRDFSQLELDIS
ncbi:MAG: SMC-Scp complex subunit ScpB [Fimbriimonadaceae bacterium]|nr:SMC-Scp complex subunit ScpB [Fimbriimonadaceae bacterium]